jgi:molybdopterin converting factor small subunit
VAEAIAVLYDAGTAGCWVELFGPARLAAGVRDVILPLPTVTRVDALVKALAHACPALAEGVLDVTVGTAGEGYILNRNGREFLPRPDMVIAPGDHVLVLSSAVGG